MNHLWFEGLWTGSTTHWKDLTEKNEHCYFSHEPRNLSEQQLQFWSVPHTLEDMMYSAWIIRTTFKYFLWGICIRFEVFWMLSATQMEEKMDFKKLASHLPHIFHIKTTPLNCRYIAWLIQRHAWCSIKRLVNVLTISPSANRTLSRMPNVFCDDMKYYLEQKNSIVKETEWCNNAKYSFSPDINAYGCLTSSIYLHQVDKKFILDHVPT